MPVDTSWAIFAGALIAASAAYCGHSIAWLNIEEQKKKWQKDWEIAAANRTEDKAEARSTRQEDKAEARSKAYNEGKVKAYQSLWAKIREFEKEYMDGEQSGVRASEVWVFLHDEKPFIDPPDQQLVENYISNWKRAASYHQQMLQLAGKGEDITSIEYQVFTRRYAEAEQLTLNIEKLRDRILARITAVLKGEA